MRFADGVEIIPQIDDPVAVSIKHGAVMVRVVGLHTQLFGQQHRGFRSQRAAGKQAADFAADHIG
ncbi:hypothetical protein D3C75_759470 [compost metagenome]